MGRLLYYCVPISEGPLSEVPLASSPGSMPSEFMEASRSKAVKTLFCLVEGKPGFEARFHCNSTTCVLLSQYAMLVLIGPVHVMYFEPYQFIVIDKLNTHYLELRYFIKRPVASLSVRGASYS